MQLEIMGSKYTGSERQMLHTFSHVETKFNCLCIYMCVFICWEKATKLEVGNSNGLHGEPGGAGRDVENRDGGELKYSDSYENYVRKAKILCII